MTTGGPDTPYLTHDPNASAYTWTSSSEPYVLTYREPQMHPQMTYRHWPTDTPMHPAPGFVQTAPVSYHSSPLTFATDVVDADSTGLSSATIAFDDATIDGPLGRGSSKHPKRVSRRPNPVIVPNLTKKARGRPVPTKDTPLKPGSGRVYACPVEECRKVFTRSEHLKRHTRSIHTNEKPFRCDIPNCDRLFTRHDNLLQHLKNHRDSPCARDASAGYGPLDRVQISQSSPEPSSSQGAPSSTMSVLIPSSMSTMGLPISGQTMQQYEVSSYGGDMERAIGDPSSPGSTPGPGESPYLSYNYGYSWPQSDMRSLPQDTYSGAVAEPRYSHPATDGLGAALPGPYAFHA